MGQSIGEDIQRRADQEVNRILSEQYDRGMKLLTENKDVLDAIAKTLIKEEKINGIELMKVIQEVKPDLVSKKALAAIEKFEKFMQPGSDK